MPSFLVGQKVTSDSLFLVYWELKIKGARLLMKLIGFIDSNRDPASKFSISIWPGWAFYFLPLSFSID